MNNDQLYLAAVGATVRFLREKAAMSQAQLGGLVGLTQSGVSKVERGDRVVSVLELRRIAVALRIDPNAMTKKVDDTYDAALKGLTLVKRQAHKLSKEALSGLALFVLETRK